MFSRISVVAFYALFAFTILAAAIPGGKPTTTTPPVTTTVTVTAVSTRTVVSASLVVRADDNLSLSFSLSYSLGLLRPNPLVAAPLARFNVATALRR